MKTTIDVDEKKLKAVMRMTGIKTRKAAIDYALARAEKMARITQLFEKALPANAYREAIDPSYDLLAVREKEKPGHHVAHFACVPGLKVRRNLPHHPPGYRPVG